jgi:hypothetical protein
MQVALRYQEEPMNDSSRDAAQVYSLARDGLALSGVARGGFSFSRTQQANHGRLIGDYDKALRAMPEAAA